MKRIQHPDEGIASRAPWPRNGRMTASLVLVAAAIVGAASSAALGEPAADAADTRPVGSSPDVCLEVDASTIDAETWAQVAGAVATAVEDEPEFFPDPVIVALPDPAQAWSGEDVATARIGIWGAAGEAGATAERREALAAEECLAEGAGWTTTISQGLLQTGAEQIMAAARLPDESGEPPIREDAEVSIAIELLPAEMLVRTTFEFRLSIPFNPGGTCWIDDVLAVDPAAGSVIASTTTGMDTGLFMESGCHKFQAFMTEGGAGEQGISLLPAAVSLRDGSTLSFTATSVKMTDDTIEMSGTVTRWDHPRWPDACPHRRCEPWPATGRAIRVPARATASVG